MPAPLILISIEFQEVKKGYTRLLG